MTVISVIIDGIRRWKERCDGLCFPDAQEIRQLSLQPRQHGSINQDQDKDETITTSLSRSVVSTASYIISTCHHQACITRLSEKQSVRALCLMNMDAFSVSFRSALFHFTPFHLADSRKIRLNEMNWALNPPETVSILKWKICDWVVCFRIMDIEAHFLNCLLMN